MDIEDAIVRSVAETCKEKNLHATNIVNDGENIRWSSTLGILGTVHYYVSFSRFQENLECGMRVVSILIAFADLITKERNKGMIDNIKEATNRGSRTYFYISSSDTDTIKMFIPTADSSRGFTSVPIKFTQSEDGEYVWTIPESAELFVSLNNHEGIGGMTPAERSRAISDYAGLEQRTSSGVSILYTTQNVRSLQSGF